MLFPWIGGAVVHFLILQLIRLLTFILIHLAPRHLNSDPLILGLTKLTSVLKQPSGLLQIIWPFESFFPGFFLMTALASHAIWGGLIAYSYKRFRH